MTLAKVVGALAVISSIITFAGFMTGYFSLPQILGHGRAVSTTIPTTIESPNQTKSLPPTGGETSKPNQNAATADASSNQSQVPDVPAAILAQSDHPYANSALQKVSISKPGASDIRIHFYRLELGSGDYLRIKTSTGHTLKSISSSMNGRDFWTDAYAHENLMLEFTSDSSGVGYGFVIDKVEERYGLGPQNDLPETYHPYANDVENKWTISRPGVKDIRLHFGKLELKSNDYLRLKTSSGKTLKSISSSMNGTDVWTDFYQYDTMILEFSTDDSGVGYGFKVDRVETR